MSDTVVQEGFVEFGEYRTWYQVTGVLGVAGKPPLVVLHGGPGATHDYLLAFAALAGDDRAVVHYDQLGNGKSTHLPEQGEDFWTVDVFVDELSNLLTKIGIADGYNLLGQSWGGVLAAEHAVTQPAGLRSLILANTPCSMELFAAGAGRLRASLPDDVEKALRQHEEAGTTESDEYQQAMQVFYERHLCRLSPWPEELVRSFSLLEEDPTVYFTMNGPSEFHVVGTLRDWSIIDRLGRIDVPTLLISGSHDEVTPTAVLPYHEAIADVRWEIMANSSHMPHLEETERCLGIVSGFLDDHESRVI